MKRPNRSKPKDDEDDTEEEEEQPLSGLAKIAQENPVGLIATAAAIAILLICGTAYGAYRLVSKPASEVANSAGNLGSSKTSETSKPTSEKLKNTGVSKARSNQANGAKKKTTAPPNKPNDFSELNDNGFLSQDSDAENPTAFENKVDELIAHRGNQNKMPKQNQQPAQPNQNAKNQDATVVNQSKNAGEQPLQQVANMQAEPDTSTTTNGGGDGSVQKATQEKSESKAASTDVAKPTATEPDSAKKKVAQPKANEDPFTKLPNTFDLPDIEDLNETTISSLVTSNRFLMGAELDAPPEISKSKLIFEMNRSSDNKQKWLVSAKRRPKEKGTEIAYFLKTETDLRFGWLPEAPKNKYAPFLRNCFVKFEVGDFTKWIGLRKPILLDPLLLTAEEPFASLETVIPTLPRLESISIEVLPLKLNKEEYSIDPSKILPGGSARILLKRNDSKAIVWIQTEAALRTKLKINTGLVLLVNGQTQPIKSAGAFNNLIASLKQFEIGALQNWEKAKATRAKSGQGEEFERIRKEYEKVYKQAQSHTEKAIEYRDRLPLFLGQPISLRIYASFGDKQIILAKMKKSTENSSKN